MLYLYASGVALFLIFILVIKRRPSRAYSIKLFLPELVCVGCVSRIEGGLKKVKGFEKVEADILKKELEILFKAPVDKNEVLRAVREKGYKEIQIKEPA